MKTEKKILWVVLTAGFCLPITHAGTAFAATDDTVAEAARQAAISVASDSLGYATQIAVTSATGNAVAGRVVGEAVKTTVGEVLDVGGQQVGEAVGKSLHTWRLAIAAQSELAERMRQEQEWNAFLQSSTEPDPSSASMASMSAEEVEVVEEVSEPEHGAMAPPTTEPDPSSASMASMSAEEVEVVEEVSEPEHDAIEIFLGASLRWFHPAEDELGALKNAYDEFRPDAFDAPDGDVGVTPAKPPRFGPTRPMAMSA